MVNRLLRILHREIPSIHQAAYLLGFFAFGSQILALFRDRLLAHAFGAGQTLDVYYAAFRIPDFIFATLASLVSLSVLIPFLIERLPESGKTHDEALKFLDAIFSAYCVAMVLICGVAFLIAPQFVASFFPHLAKEQATIVLLTRIMLFSPFLLGLSNLFASITQAYNRFSLYALSPVLYNAGIIIGVVVLYPLFGIAGLGWGVALGAFMHVGIQIPFVLEQKLLPRLRPLFSWKEIKPVVFLSLPRTLALSANEIAEFLLVSMASYLGTGSIAVFNLSWNLQSVPLSIIGVSYALAVFPTLTRLFSKGQKEEFIEQTTTTIRHIVFLSLPVTVLFVLLRAHIVRVILGSGAFNWDDTRLTAAAVALFVISLIPQSLTVLFIRACYAEGQTRRPLILNVVSSILIVIFGIVFVNVFNAVPAVQVFFETVLRVGGVAGTSVLMLPFAYTVGTTINAVLLWIMFERRYKGMTKKVWKTFYQSVLASAALAVVAYIILAFLGSYLPTETFLGIFGQGFFAGMLGIGAAILVLYMLKSKELFDMSHALRKKIWKTNIIPPDPTL